MANVQVTIHGKVLAWEKVVNIMPFANALHAMASYFLF